MTPAKPADHCFHCGLPIPAGTHWSVEISGSKEPMCCPGCKAVAQAIVDSGLQSYYTQRSADADTGAAPKPDALDTLELFDQPEVQKSFVRPKDNTNDSLSEAALILEGIHCAACIWLNEKHIQQLDGVHSVHINYATHRATVSWDNAKIKLSQILNAIESIGYHAHPYDPTRQQLILEKEKRDYLKRIGLAGILGMQVMVLAVAMYVGDWTGMEQNFRSFFSWLSLLLTIPVLTYSARPFFVGALRDLKHFHAGMDVPVSIGMALAFVGSAWNTWTGSGHVYYESVSMFVFFLLMARYLEMLARKRSSETNEALVQAVPAMARRVEHKTGDESWVAAASLQTGDLIRIRAGEPIATDGKIWEGKTSVDESLITGEHQSIQKETGDEVIGGSINTSAAVVVEVTHTGDDTILSAIQRLMDQAQSSKPHISRLADQAAGWFVSAILLLAAIVAIYWYLRDPDQWLAITVSVLVVTCPCALSLATPTALTAATGVLTRLGLIPSSAVAIERLAKIKHMVFDKTGTLTMGMPGISKTMCLGELDQQQLLQIAAALESHSEHPIAHAFVNAAKKIIPLNAETVEYTVGAGLSGTVNQQRYRIGRLDFVTEPFSATVKQPELQQAATGLTTVVYLANEQQLLAAFELSDRPRPGIEPTIRELKKRELSLAILSGDHLDSVRQIADDLDITHYRAGLNPESKLEAIHALQRKDQTVAMIGDGINDAPVLAAADISIAMGAGTQLAASKADFILVNNNLPSVVQGVDLSRKTMHIIRQNLGWAVIYNLSALPLAAAGMVPPWLAALGMSGSSLLVVLNALRLTRYKNTGENKF